MRPRVRQSAITVDRRSPDRLSVYAGPYSQGNAYGAWPRATNYLDSTQAKLAASSVLPFPVHFATAG